MINLNQIRKGNLFNVDGGAMMRVSVERFYIDEQDRDCVVIGTTMELLKRTCACPVELLEGIPITEDELMNLGFEWDMVTAMFYYEGIGIIDNGEQGYHALLTPHDYLLSVPVPCLHDLQNLFFYVKGKELPVKVAHFDLQEQ